MAGADRYVDGDSLWKLILSVEKEFHARIHYELDDERHRQLLCPDGFAHGFCVISEVADVAYKTSAYYDPESESGFAFDDPAVAIEWPPGLELIVSGRDRAAPALAQIAGTLPFRYPVAP